MLLSNTTDIFEAFKVDIIQQWSTPTCITEHKAKMLFLVLSEIADKLQFQNIT